jgi:hypothetical protein
MFLVPMKLYAWDCNRLLGMRRHARLMMKLHLHFY